MAYIPANAKWYLATIVEEIRVEGQNPNIIHKNLVLIRGDSPEQAYERAHELGTQAELQYENLSGKTVQVTFKGLNALNVVHDELEHGAELQYEELRGLSSDEVKGLIPRKEDLAVFRPLAPADRPDYSSKEVLEKAVELLKQDTH
ncbi:MAG TPA: DUF4288 domain-containing protein [Terriglobales bacterium]|nr:DUF4288 domain-containing protein [Terriglobales bacterium]